MFRQCLSVSVGAVIFYKILNPTGNLFVGFCLCCVNWPLKSFRSQQIGYIYRT